MRPDAAPFASWPRHLQEAWHDCAQRGEVEFCEGMRHYWLEPVFVREA